MRVVDRGSSRHFLPLESMVQVPLQDTELSSLGGGALGGTLVTLGSLSLRSNQSQRLFLKPAIPLSPGEEQQEQTEVQVPGKVASSPFWRHSPGLLSASLFSPREQEGWPYGVLLVPSVFLLSPYDPSYPFPQAIPNKPCLSRGIHWVVCEDFSRVLSVAPTPEAPWLPCLSQGWRSGRGTAAPGFPRELRCYSHL